MKCYLEFNACKSPVMTFKSTYALTTRNVPQDHLPITTCADLLHVVRMASIRTIKMEATDNLATLQTDGIDWPLVPTQRAT